MSKAAPAKVASAAPAATHVREKNIELALSSITKQFGEGSIMRLGSNARMKVETLSTGSLAIDLALGVGGLPKGRIIEVQLAPRIHNWFDRCYTNVPIWHN
jgi:recombination protein RecA